MRLSEPALACSLALLLVPGAAVRAGEGAGAPELPELELMEAPVRAQIEEARGHLEGLLGRRDALSEELAVAYGRLGALLLLYDLTDPAERALARAGELAPHEYRWAYLLAVLEERRGRLDASAASLERALALAPSDLATLLRLGRVEIDRGRPQAAVPRYRRALELDPRSAAAHAGLGEAAALGGDHREAVERLESALALQPRATALHYQLGLAFRELGDLERARRHLAEAGREPVRFEDPLLEELGHLRRGAASFMVEGNAAVAGGRLEDAVAAYRQAVAAAPEDARARAALASLLARKGDRREALAEYAEVLRRQPNDHVALYNVGLLLTREERLEEAIDHFRRAVALAPDFADAHFNLAAALEAAGRPADAAPHYARVVELEPGDGEARGRYGRLLHDLAAALGRAGRFEAAAARFAEVIALQPDHEGALFGRGSALLLAGRDAEARAHFEAAVARLPASVPLRHALARLLATSADPAARDGARALELARQVVAEEPGFDHAETVAMALAELGRFEEAIRWQREISGRAERAGREDLLAGLRAHLALFEAGQPVRAPWRRGADR